MTCSKDEESQKENAKAPKRQAGTDIIFNGLFSLVHEKLYLCFQIQTRFFYFKGQKKLKKLQKSYL